jgi:putative methionine-R-sulfoxide reductase with GAF domain
LALLNNIKNDKAFKKSAFLPFCKLLHNVLFNYFPLERLAMTIYPYLLFPYLHRVKTSPAYVACMRHLNKKTIRMSTKKTARLESIIAHLHRPNIDWQQLLSEIIMHYECSTGTLHFLDADTSLLKLKAHQGIPDFLLPKLLEIPIGKGMAGIAAERREPVEMCNLQTDASGVARPAAKDTKVEGSIVVPMLYHNALFGTLGIAKTVPYDFTKTEINELLMVATEMCRALSSR